MFGNAVIRVRQLYRNTLTTDFAQAFQNDHNNEHMDAVNEISQLVSQVIPSHSAKSQYFFDVHGGIYSVNVFPS